MGRTREFERRAGLARAVVSVTLSGLVVMAAGCPVAGPGGLVSSGYEDGNVDESLRSPRGKTSGEPNDDFDEPVVAVFDESGLARLKGTVQSSGDLDVFLLGGFDAGDRVIADAFAVNNLDVTIAVFDQEGRLVADNDDRTNQNLDSHVDFIVRHGGDPYYLVVGSSAFAVSRRTTGTYTADVEVESGGNVPDPVPQTLFLKFDGGVVDSPQLGQMDLNEFNAGDISRAYSGKTQEVKNAIVEVVLENYSRFNVVVRTSDDFEPGDDDEFTTIFFGGFDDSAFGIAENVDLYNADLCDDAIIFVESFSPFLFSQTPSAREMGIAIGNVASHEAGHLLGLNHVDDDLDLMDDRSPADVFLIDQEFKESPLSSDIMPIGTQDSVLLLNEIVGPAGDEGSRVVASSKVQIQTWPGLGGAEIVKRRSAAIVKPNN